jgi:hypothetical protein
MTTSFDTKHPYRITGIVQLTVEGTTYEQPYNDVVRALTGDEAAASVLRWFGQIYTTEARWHSTPSVVRERERGA